ncbi:MAG: hypothetical protein HYX38_31910 [Rhodospirillales bacterium]|nr:hypothetical protein [Rhodospirillales bacterium]
METILSMVNETALYHRPHRARRGDSCSGSVVPLAQPDIHVGTADDITQADHVVNISDACSL